jgi:hypothetical protein
VNKNEKMLCTLCVKFPNLTTRSVKKDKNKNKVRKIYLFSNNKTLSVMLRMQDFTLNISKFSCEGMSPNPPR